MPTATGRRMARDQHVPSDEITDKSVPMIFFKTCSGNVPGRPRFAAGRAALLVRLLMFRPHEVVDLHSREDRENGARAEDGREVGAKPCRIRLGVLHHFSPIAHGQRFLAQRPQAVARFHRRFNLAVVKHHEFDLH